MGVVAALLALDGNEVVRALPLGITALAGLIGSVAALVAAFNARQTKKLTKQNGGVHEHEDGTVTGSVLDLLVEMRTDVKGMAARMDSQDDEIADVKQAVADIATTAKFVMHEMASEKVRAQYAEAELSARIDQERNR